MQPRLFVVGDSFAQPLKETQRAQTWLEILGQELGRHHGCDIEVINKSCYGVAQDFNWFFLQMWAEAGEITADDYVVVVLTHPSRYWYFEDEPDLSNGQFIIGFDQHVTAAQEQAVRSYISEIQRPTLDCVQMVSRLGWLANAVTEYGWRRPLVIRGFPFDTFAAGSYCNLNWARGCLFDIQIGEFEPDAELDRTTVYFEGIDCRYNHLCLSNHQILGHRASQALINNSVLDLTEGYLKNIMPPAVDADPDFAQREWCPDQVELFFQRRQENKLRKFKKWIK